MSDEGNSSNSFRIGGNLFLVFFVTGISCLIAIWILQFAIYISNTIRAQVLLLSACCFFLGSLLLVFTEKSKEKLFLWSCGFIVALGALVVSFIYYLYLLILTYPVIALIVAGIIAIPAVFLYQRYLQRNGPGISVPAGAEVVSYSQISISSKTIIGGVELIQLPEEHLNTADPQRFKPFLNLLRGLTLADIPLALRIERDNQKTRVFYLTWAKHESTLSEYIVRLEDNLQGNLSGMKFKPCPQFTGKSLSPSQTAVFSYLTGEPLSIEDNEVGQDTLSAVAAVLQSLPNGIIQISATPTQFSNRKLKGLEEKYRAKVAESERTISTPKSTLLSGDIHESTTRVNSRAQREARSLAKQIERVSKRHLCEVYVTALCWETEAAIAEDHSKRLLTPLRGNLTPANDEQDFSMKTLHNLRDAGKFLRGEPVGKSTLLSIDEATIYFIIPRYDLGIPVVDEASFHTNPATLVPVKTQPDNEIKSQRPVITLGKVLDPSGRVIADFEIPIEDLASHSGIYGDTGSGKTMTQLAILLELTAKKIPWLALLASKYEDYVKLGHVIKGLRIFTIGDETTSPARFSLTNTHAGVHVNSIINGIKAVFVAAKPTDGMVKEYLEAVIELTFKRMGWDRDSNTRGLPIILQDFLATIPLLEKEFQYSTRGNEDFRGAIYGRLRSMCIGALSSVFGTVTGISISELVSRPTIIRVDKLSKEEQAFFIYWLINNIIQYFEAEKMAGVDADAPLKYYVTLEEAHHFLSGGQIVKTDEGHGAQNIAIDTISIGISESRSSKVGFGLVTQQPSKLNNETCSMTMNMGMHRKGKLAERQLIGGQMNCNEEQIKMMGSLPVGHVIFQTASNNKPVRVRVTHPHEKYPALAKGRPLTDDEIRSFMASVYEKFSRIKERQGFTKLIPELSELNVEHAMISIDIPSVLRLYNILDYLSEKGYNMGIQRSIENGSLIPVALMVKNLVSSATDNQDLIPFLCHHLLWRFSSMDESWTDEARRNVVLALSHVLSIDMLSMSDGLDDTHLRIQTASSHHPSVGSLTDDELESIVKSAFKRTGEEYSAMPIEVKPKGRSHLTDESPLVETISQIISVDVFSDSFRERVYRATQGNTAPLVRLIQTLTKKFTDPSDDPLVFSLTLLKRASEYHNTPIDDVLWKRLETDLTSKSS